MNLNPCACAHHTYSLSAISSPLRPPFPTAIDLSCRQNRYILQQSSAYGADLFTPHLPQAASSPQAPQGEDKRWCGAEFNTALTCGGSFPVSSVTSTPGSRNMRIGSCVKAPLKKRGSHGFIRSFDTGQPETYVSVDAPMRL